MHFDYLLIAELSTQDFSDVGFGKCVSEAFGTLTTNKLTASPSF